MRIGELAQATGVTTKTIRYYEDVGLLPPAARADNGYRVYDESAVERLRFVRDAAQTGLSLAEIGSILDLRQQGVGTCHHVTELLARHLVALDRQIETLIAGRAQLQTIAERARALDPQDCTDPIRCQTIERGTDTRQTAHHARSGVR